MLSIDSPNSLYILKIQKCDSFVPPHYVYKYITNVCQPNSSEQEKD